MKKRIFSFLLAIIMLQSTLLIGICQADAAEIITEAQVQERLSSAELRWKNNTTYVDRLDDGVYTCFGFMRELFYYIYGVHMPNSWNTSTGSFYNNRSYSQNVREIGHLGRGYTVDDLSALLLKAKPGDILVMSSGNGNHCVMVRSVDFGGKGIYNYDANSDWKNTIFTNDHRSAESIRRTKPAGVTLYRYVNYADTNLITITFDPTGGTVSQSTQQIQQGSNPKNLPTATRDGYIFTGWFLDPDGPSGIVDENTGWNFESDTTIYARWRKDPNSDTDEGWSEWQDTPIAATSTREVQTRVVVDVEGYTEYRYVGYATRDGLHECWCGEYLTRKFGNAVLRYSDWSTTRYDVNGSYWTCGYCNGNHQNVHYHDAQGRPRWGEYTLSDGKNYYWEESRTIGTTYKTQYRYRDISTPGTSASSSGGHWGPWSDWSDTSFIESNTRQIEQQKVPFSEEYTEYRYVGYATPDGAHEAWCETYLSSLFGPVILRYSDWSTTRYNTNGEYWTCGYCNGNHINVHYYDEKGRPRWGEYTLPDGKNYYWEESRTIPAQYKTQYRYRDWIQD